MRTPDQLYDAFCDFIEHNRRHRLTDFPMDAPAFFLPDTKSIVNMVLGHDVSTVPAPFPLYWTISEFVGGIITDDRSAVIVSAMNNSEAVGKFSGVVRNGAFIWINLTRAARESNGKFASFYRAQNTLIAGGRREEVETERLSAINRGRAKSKNTILKPIPRFTLITAPSSDRDGEALGGGGWTQRPHERRGHYRNLKSGKRIWVRDCSIHGGGGERNYVVKR